VLSRIGAFFGRKDAAILSWEETAVKNNERLPVTSSSIFWTRTADKRTTQKSLYLGSLGQHLAAVPPVTVAVFEGTLGAILKPGCAVQFQQLDKRLVAFSSGTR
jgi:hypothetical protein